MSRSASGGQTREVDVEKSERPLAEDDLVIDGFAGEDSSGGSGSDDDGQSRKGDDSKDSPSRREPETASIANRVMSRITTRSSMPPPPPPDGGFTAWMVGMSDGGLRVWFGDAC